jgi:ABC-type tungstate transport system permease subunit
MRRRKKMLNSKKVKVDLVAVLLVLAFAPFGYPAECKLTVGDGNPTVGLATGSPGELGLLEALAQVFNENHETSICWIRAGSGKSLKLLNQKAVDMERACMAKRCITTQNMPNSMTIKQRMFYEQLKGVRSGP